jgi:phospholipase/carboxylesterase
MLGSQPSSSIQWQSDGQIRSVQLPLQACIHQTGEQVARVIIALHGYGDNARNFSSLADELSLKDTLWIFLQAPESPPFPGDGGQWYELFGNPHGQFYSSLQKVIESSRVIQDAIKLSWNKLLFLGFSQGAFLSLFSALTHPERVAGVVALSGYLAQSHKLTDLPAARQDLPVFIAHGLHDQVVFPAQHFETRDILSHLGFHNITAKTYAGVAHSLCAEELYDIRTFIEGLT